MNRRGFLRLAAGTVIGLPVGTFLVSCGSYDGYGSTPSGDAPAAGPQRSGTQTVYTTSEVGSHFHTFGIADTAFAAPPAAGLDGSTSIAASHSHPVAVSMAMLAGVTAGQTVRVTTGLAGGHTHVLTLVKLSAAPSPTDAGLSDIDSDPYTLPPIYSCGGSSCGSGPR